MPLIWLMWLDKNGSQNELIGMGAIQIICDIFRHFSDPQFKILYLKLTALRLRQKESAVKCLLKPNLAIKQKH